MSSEIELFGIPDQMEITVPSTGEVVVIKQSPKQDDFNRVSDDLNAQPRYTRACERCGKVHTADEMPLCICSECGQLGRLFNNLNGLCTECAYKCYAGHGVPEEVLNQMECFSKYIEWKKNQAKTVQKMPWEE